MESANDVTKQLGLRKEVAQDCTVSRNVILENGPPHANVKTEPDVKSMMMMMIDDE